MIFEHGIGGGKDLPIPVALAVAGAVAAITLSFVVLALAWRSPRFDGARQGLPVPRLAQVVDSTWFAWTIRLLGLIFTAYVAWAAIAGPDLLANPFFGVVYVLLWVGIVPASLLFGPAYKAVNPIRTLHLLLSKVTGLSPSVGVARLPSWVGLWPGALGLFAFVWLELVHERSTYLADLRLWCAVYVAIVFIGAAIFGDRWIESADPFEVFSTLVGRLSVFGRTADGTLVVRNPLANLDSTPATQGLTGVLSVLFGSTAYDSFRESPTWLKVVQSDPPLDLSRPVLNTLCLLGFVVAVFLTFSVATMLTGVRDDHSRWRLPDQLAHAVVPIVVGYMVAHYLSFLVLSGQDTIKKLSDPMVRGDDYFGTADLVINYGIALHPTMLAYIKVTAVVCGHLLGVISSHDRAIKLLPKRHQLTGQLSLLLVMVLYTVTGLYLLLSA